MRQNPSDVQQRALELKNSEGAIKRGRDQRMHGRGEFTIKPLLVESRGERGQGAGRKSHKMLLGDLLLSR